MEEELKEVWTTLILPVTRFSNNDYYRRKDKGLIKAFDNLSEYKPTYLPVGAMGYDGSNKTYRLLKPIKVRKPEGGFDYYMVPEFAVEGVYVDLPKQVVEPIPNLVTLENLLVTLQLPLQVSPQKPVAQKSNPIVKLPVPLNLLPYIANVSSDGVPFFNIPEGYTNDLFEQAVKAVYALNNGLAQKPMVYYEQPQQLILQLKQLLLAVLLSLKQYLAQRQLIALLSLAQKLQTVLLSLQQRLLATLGLNIKYNTSNNTKTVKVPVENTGEPDLVTEVFAYPSRRVDVYNIHPEVYLKALEYLNKNYQKTKTDNKPAKYVLSLYGFDKVPIGGEVNDSIYHYIGKNGKDESIVKYYYYNANIVNKNEPVSENDIYSDIVTKNGKLKMYLNPNGHSVHYEDRYGKLDYHPFTWKAYNNVNNTSLENNNSWISELMGRGLTKLQAKDYSNKDTNYMYNEYDYNMDKSIFHPIEKLLQSNIVLKAKLKAKLAGKKVLSLLGFLNGGQLKYYKNGK